VAKEKQSKPPARKESGKKHTKESEKKQEKNKDEDDEAAAKKEDKTQAAKKDNNAKPDKPPEITITAKSNATPSGSLIEDIANSKPIPVSPAGADAHIGSAIPAIPAFSLPGISISPVTIVLFLGLATFWLGMLLKALSGSRGKGMRSRLAEDDD
jgi:hypothetical protein